MDVLYIIMRNDLRSLNPGKAMAQASHAYGALKARVRSAIGMQTRYLAWMNQTDQEFGTTIVLTGTEGEIDDALSWAERWAGGKVLHGWVFDPTYPLRDGGVTHLIPLSTCAFVFGNKEDCEDVIGHLDLHP